MKAFWLSGNMLKIIAAISMTIDHIGIILFPDNMLLRIIGRLAFPIFAFLIAEGCRYTKNKPRYFFVMAFFAVVFQAFYTLFTADMYLNIFFTLSFAILIIYSLQFFSDAIKSKNVMKSIFSSTLVIFIIACVYIVGRYFMIDYGFWGCMLPTFAYVVPVGTSIFMKLLRIALFGVGMFPLIGSVEIPVQAYEYLALIPLLFYNGKRGKYNMKYFFYIFYPLHIVIIYAFDILIT